MEGHAAPGDYKDVILFLVTAGVIVPLFRRWKLNPILGFLVGGILLGPQGLGGLGQQFPWLADFTIDNPREVAQLADFGVVFLLFMIGLELSWERLRLMRRLVFGLGGLQVTLTVAVLTAGAMALGLAPAAAAAVGAALALSSTAVVIPILVEQKRQHSLAGRGVFSVLLFQDLAVAPILITLAVLAHQTDEALSPRLLLAFAPAALAIVGILAFGRFLLRPMLRSVARAKSEDLFMAACLLVVLGAGLVSAATGLSMALGAFIAGLLLAETEYRHEVEVTIEPFKGLLLGLFFLSVGIGLDVSVLVSHPWLIAGLVLGLLMIKAALVWPLARAFGLKGMAGLEAALLLAGGGEFAFVILSTAISDGVVDRALGQSLLVAATLSMMSIPLWSSLARRLAARDRPDGSSWQGPDLASAQVLVVGYGRVGRLVSDMLTEHGISWAAAERESRLVEAARAEGKPVHFGDASRPDFLRRCGLELASALVVTTDAPDGVETIVATARQLSPALRIIARARDARQAQRLYDLGANDAVPETVEASLQLSEAVLVEVGVPMGLVIASIHQRRDDVRKLLNRPEALGGRARRYRLGG